MLERYKEKEDLWFLWPSATTAIFKHIDSNEPINSESGWIFREGLVKQHIGRHAGYIVSVISTGFDTVDRKLMFLSVQADVSFDDDISVRTIKRCEVTDNLERCF